MELQPASQEIYDKKYRLKDSSGVPIDKDVDATFQRVAKALSMVELPKLQEYWYERFLWALRNGAITAGRTTANAGAKQYKPDTSLINCTVSGTIHDSMDDILTKLHEAGMTLKAGCGTGYEFTTLRPDGAMVTGSGSSTSGPLPFMDIYDTMCKTVSSAGGRRGAQMGTGSVIHPDIPPFIRAKREDGRLRQFNLSVLITEAFIQAVKDDLDWNLVFPASKSELERNVFELVKQPWPVTDGYEVDENGLVTCRVYETMAARELWDLIMNSTYEYSEPGFIMIDRVNQMNNNWFCEDIRATNPCGV